MNEFPMKRTDQFKGKFNNDKIYNIYRYVVWYVSIDKISFETISDNIVQICSVHVLIYCFQNATLIHSLIHSFIWMTNKHRQSVFNIFDNQLTRESCVGEEKKIVVSCFGKSRRVKIVFYYRWYIRYIILQQKQSIRTGWH